MLAVPPDQSRFHSRAGDLTRYAWEHYGDRFKAVLPALGTHTPMQPEAIARMFGAIPQELFHVHNWRTDVETLGEVPAEFIHEQSEGKLNYSWPAQVNRLITRGGFDLILSIGQVVPHEVIGMANYNKNILIGTGGRESINRSHYLGAVYGMERIMGRAENPVRNVFELCCRSFPAASAHRLRADRSGPRQPMADWRCAASSSATTSSAFNRAAELSLKVNFEIVDAADPQGRRLSRPA